MHGNLKVLGPLRLTQPICYITRHIIVILSSSPYLLNEVKSLKFSVQDKFYEEPLIGKPMMFCEVSDIPVKETLHSASLHSEDVLAS